MIFSVMVTYEALDAEAALAERRRIEELLDEIGRFVVSDVAEVAPLVTDDDFDLPPDYWETAQ